MNWIQALKEWNSGKDKYCIPRKGSPDYEEVRELMRIGHKTEPAREKFLFSERNKALDIYFRYEDATTARGKKLREKAAKLVEAYDEELRDLIANKPQRRYELTKKERRELEKSYEMFAKSLREAREAHEARKAREADELDARPVRG